MQFVHCVCENNSMSNQSDHTKISCFDKFNRVVNYFNTKGELNAKDFFFTRFNLFWKCQVGMLKEHFPNLHLFRRLTLISCIANKLPSMRKSYTFHLWKCHDKISRLHEKNQEKKNNTANKSGWKEWHNENMQSVTSILHPYS
jgi:hypothetical protein